MFFWNPLAFSMIQRMLAIWSLVPLPFLKPACFWNFTVHVLLKPGLENFEHYFTNVWDECNCAVVWAFFGIAFLWHWDENWLFPTVVTAEFSKFVYILSAALSQHHPLGFEIATGIPSPPLTLFIVMLPKAHLILCPRMSGSRWVITPSWLSGSLRYFLYGFSVYSCHLFLISSASVRSILFLPFIVPIFAWNSGIKYTCKKIHK